MILEIILAIVGGYIAFALFARRYAKNHPDGIFEIKGPAVLLRSKRIVGLFERGAEKYPRVILYGSKLGVIIIIILMFLMMSSILLMLATPILYMMAPPEVQQATQPIPHSIYEPQNLLLIPGINDYVPSTAAVWIGLILAIVIHEFAHGFVSRTEKIKVKSAGIVLALLPIGAFVDPDDDELKAAPVKSKLRIAAAGVASNVLIGLVCMFAAVGIVAYLLPATGDAITITSIAKNLLAHPISGTLGCIIVPVVGRSLPISVLFMSSAYTSLFSIPWFMWIPVHTLFWTGWISIALAMFNALPVLPLDGGLFAWGWIGDWLQRKGVPERAINIFSACMSIIIMSMMIGGLILSAVILPSV